MYEAPYFYGIYRNDCIRAQVQRRATVTSGKALEARGADHRWHPSSDLEPLTSLVPRLPGLRGWISHPVPPAYQVKRYIDWKIWSRFY